jgi:hypothetical protein
MCENPENGGRADGTTRYCSIVVLVELEVFTTTGTGSIGISLLVCIVGAHTSIQYAFFSQFAFIYSHEVGIVLIGSFIFSRAEQELCTMLVLVSCVH